MKIMSNFVKNKNLNFKLYLVLKKGDVIFIKKGLLFNSFITIDCSYFTSIEGMKLLIDFKLTEYNVLKEFGDVKSLKIFKIKSSWFVVADLSSQSVVSLKCLNLKRGVVGLKNLYLMFKLRYLKEVMG